MGFGLQCILIASSLHVMVPSLSSEPCQTGEQFTHNSSCEMYYICKNGVKDLSYCPEGEYYNPKVQKCGSLANVTEICYQDIINQIKRLKTAADKIYLSKKRGHLHRLRLKSKDRTAKSKTIAMTPVADKKTSVTGSLLSTTGKISPMNHYSARTF